MRELYCCDCRVYVLGRAWARPGQHQWGKNALRDRWTKAWIQSVRHKHPVRTSRDA